MALLAIGGESRAGVHGIAGFLEICLVTRHAGRICRAQIVIIVDVATGARRSCVNAGQRETRSRVIKFRIHPVVKAMALLAACRELAGRMVGVAGLVEVGCVAAVTVRGHRAKLAHRPALVTSIAFHRSMGAE